LIEHVRKGWASGAAFQPARLIIQTLQCGKLFLAAEPSLCNRSLQHPDRLIIDRDRHRKGVPVLAAMSDRKPRRVGKAVERAMDDLCDHRHDRTVRAPTPGINNTGKIRAGIRRRGQRRVQPSNIDIADSS
jgi:hypothetical protein